MSGLSPAEASARLRALCARAPVIPVLTIEDVATAAPLAAALVAGGLPVLEVTLRTPVALEAIAAMAGVEEAIVGAGTLLRPADMAAARRAGAVFGATPGTTPALVAAAAREGLPVLFGATSPSEAMALAEQGHDVLKFFPAAALSGPAALSALASPLPHIAFCPTGGIDAASAPDYLCLPNVAAVGGSWVAPPALVAARDWAAITALARTAAALRG